MLNAKSHVPVLVDEVVSFLEPEDQKVYVDCTIGTGGHIKQILQNAKCKMQNVKIYGMDRDDKENDEIPCLPAGRRMTNDEGMTKSKIRMTNEMSKSEIKIYGMDMDKESLEVARENLKEFEDNVEFIHGNFKDLRKIIKEPVDGVLFDLGMSSFQLEDTERGFGYKFDGEIDMRMDRTKGIPCFEMLNGLKEARFFGEKEIREIIEDFGEERFAKRIARSIYNALPMKTTFELKNSILKVIPHKRHGKTLSRVFQAFRIKVNDELLNLKQGLESAVEILKVGGRIVCISYHSLEDRIVKWFFKENEELMVLTKKPIRPSFEEVRVNRRARSAKLRVAEKKNSS